ncbi:MAG: hypothetical protein WBD81_17855 [Collimonas pratensis]|uniref:hypothetical protein n=1 Tax=Collimonas pratensis TaxID=279113 RepID=UPI003C78200C
MSEFANPQMGEMVAREEADWRRRQIIPVRIPRFTLPDERERRLVWQGPFSPRAGALTPSPFLGIWRPTPSTSGSWDIAILPGILNNTGIPNATATITDISPSVGSPNWITWNGAADIFYIDCTGIVLSSPGSESYAINSYSQGGTYDPTQPPFGSADAFVSGTPDGTVPGVVDQDEFCYPLVNVAVGAGGQPVLTQINGQNLCLLYKWRNGSPSVYPAYGNPA